MEIVLDKPVRNSEFNNSNRIVDRLIELQRENDFSLSELAREFNNYILDECKKDDNDELIDPSKTNKINLKSFVKLKDKEEICSTCETLDLVNSKLGIVSVSKNKLWDLEAKVTYYTITRPNNWFKALHLNIKENCELLKILNPEINVDKDIIKYLGHISLELIDSSRIKKENTSRKKNENKLMLRPKGTLIAVRLYQDFFYRDLIISKSLYLEKFLSKNTSKYKDLFNQQKLLRSQVNKYNLAELDALLEKENIENPESYDDYVKYFDTCNKYFESDVFNFIEEVKQHEIKNSSNTKAKEKKVEKITPVFKKEYVDDIVKILSPYFPKDKDRLDRLFRTGNIPKDKLIFYGYGKSLIYFFKQLHKTILIIKINTHLEYWISECFSYTYRGSVVPIKQSYANKIISEDVIQSKKNRLMDMEENDGVLTIKPHNSI